MGFVRIDRRSRAGFCGRDYLGPEMRKQHLGGVKLMIWDHNRDRIYERAKVVYDDPEAAQYVWGTAFHWYVGDFFNNVQLVHDAYPDKQLLFTEGCQEAFDPGKTNSWEMGKRYGSSMLNDLNRWAVGWVDWNLVLDETGGPDLAEKLLLGADHRRHPNEGVEISKDSLLLPGSLAAIHQAGSPADYRGVQPAMSWRRRLF